MSLTTSELSSWLRAECKVFWLDSVSQKISSSMELCIQTESRLTIHWAWVELTGVSFFWICIIKVLLNKLEYLFSRFTIVNQVELKFYQPRQPLHAATRFPKGHVLSHFPANAIDIYQQHEKQDWYFWIGSHGTICRLLCLCRQTLLQSIRPWQSTKDIC